MLSWFINDQGIVRSGWKVFGFFLLLMALVAVAGLGLHALGRPQVVGPWLGAALGALASLLCVKLEGRSFSGLGFLPGWLTGGTFGLEASLPCALVCGAAILGMWRWKGSKLGADAPTAPTSV